MVEATSFVAGPLAGLTLSQLGAEVIRIDHVAGAADGGRWPLSREGASLFWAGLNKGVKSVALDLRSPQGQELAMRLITASGSNAGLFVDNTIGRDFLSWERLSAMRPDLVHVHIQGKPDGSPAMDYGVNPEYGVPLLTRPLDSDRPTNHVLPAWDIATGLLSVIGLLSGLRHREVTGEGSRVELALSDVAASHVAHLGWLAETLERGGDRTPHGNHLFGAFGVDFRCRDGRRVIAVAITRQQWRDLVDLTGTRAAFEALRACGAVSDLDVEGERFKHRELIEAVLAPWFAARDAAEVLASSKGTRVMVSEYRSTSEVVAAFDRGEESRVLTAVDQPGVGPMLTATSALRWNGEYSDAVAAPVFGQDTDAVIEEILGERPTG